MVLKLDITKQDITDFNLFHRKNTPVARKRSLVYSLLFPLCLTAFFLFVSGLGPPETNPSYWIILAAGLVVIWVFFSFKILHLDYIFAIKRYFGNGGYAHTGECTLTFLEDKIIDKGRLCTFCVPYNSVELIAQSSRSLYIYINPAMAIIIPFRQLSGEGEKEKLISFLKQKCGTPDEQKCS